MKKKDMLMLMSVTLLLSMVFTIFYVGYCMGKMSVSQSNSQTVTVTTGDTKNKVNINKATEQELQTLPNIGETLSKRIVENRPYNDIWELTEIDGIGSEKMAELKDRIEV